VCPKDLKALISGVLDLMCLSHIANKMVGTVSAGSKRRIMLGLAVMGNPPLLMIDEPFAGIDPVSSQCMAKVIEHLRYFDHTLVVSTECAKYCHSVADIAGIVEDGCLVDVIKRQETLAKRGNGYLLFVYALEVAHLTPMSHIISKRLTGSSLLADSGLQRCWGIPENTSLSDILREFSLLINEYPALDFKVSGGMS